MKRINEFISSLQPQGQIQKLLEDLIEVILADFTFTKTGIVLYLPLSPPFQVEAVKSEKGEIIKTFRIGGSEISNKVEEGMSTLEIFNENELIGRIFLWKNVKDKAWDFLNLLPYLELVKLVLNKARREWMDKRELEGIAEKMRGEIKSERVTGADEIPGKQDEQITRLREEVKEREREFFSLFDVLQEGLFVIGSEGNYLAVNKAACNLLGYSEKEIKEMNAFRLDNNKLGICWKIGLGGERCEVVNARGEVVTVEISLTPFRYQGGDCFLGTMKTVADSEDGLKRKETQPVFIDETQKEGLFFSIFDNLKDGVIVMDDSGVILYCNRKIEGIFRRSKEKLIGRKLILKL